jgi:hypothetical protein
VHFSIAFGSFGEDGTLVLQVTVLWQGPDGLHHEHPLGASAEVAAIIQVSHAISGSHGSVEKSAPQLRNSVNAHIRRNHRISVCRCLLTLPSKRPK